MLIPKLGTHEIYRSNHCFVNQRMEADAIVYSLTKFYGRYYFANGVFCPFTFPSSRLAVRCPASRDFLFSCPLSRGAGPIFNSCVYFTQINGTCTTNYLQKRLGSIFFIVDRLRPFYIVSNHFANEAAVEVMVASRSKRSRLSHLELSE